MCCVRGSCQQKLHLPNNSIQHSVYFEFYLLPNIELTPLYVVRSLVLNGVGILHGWLYWQRGLESAMLAHFSTDIAVHVIGALLLG